MVESVGDPRSESGYEFVCEPLGDLAVDSVGELPGESWGVLPGEQPDADLIGNQCRAQRSISR